MGEINTSDATILQRTIQFFIHGLNIDTASGRNIPQLAASTGGVECYLPDVRSVQDGAIWLNQQVAGSDAVTITYTSTIDGADSQSTAIAMTLTTTPTKVNLTTHLQKHTWSGVRGKLFRMTCAVTAGAATNTWGASNAGMNVKIGSA